MKASFVKHTVHTFQPVDLTLTFETQEELNALFMLFNTGLIVDILREHGYQHDTWKVLANAGATDGHFHDKIVDYLKLRLLPS